MLFNCIIVFNKEINMLKYTQLYKNYLKSRSTLFSHQNNILMQQSRVIFSVNLPNIKLNIEINNYYLLF